MHVPTPERSECWPSERSVFPTKAKLLDFSILGTLKKPLSRCGFCNNSTFKNMVYSTKSGSSNIFHTYVCSYQGSTYFGFCLFVCLFVLFCYVLFFSPRGLLKEKPHDNRPYLRELFLGYLLIFKNLLMFDPINTCLHRKTKQVSFQTHHALTCLVQFSILTIPHVN